MADMSDYQEALDAAEKRVSALERRLWIAGGALLAAMVAWFSWIYVAHGSGALADNLLSAGVALAVTLLLTWR